MRMTVLDDVTFSNAALPALYYPSPSQLFGSALKLWLKADAGVTQTAGVVNSWQDQSASGYVFNATGSTDHPLAVTPNSQAGLPGLQNNSVVQGNNGGYATTGAHQSAVAFEYNQPFSVAITYRFIAEQYAFAWAMSQLGNQPNIRGWCLDLSAFNCDLQLVNVFSEPGNPRAGLTFSPVVNGVYHGVITYDGSGLLTGFRCYLNGAPNTPTTGGGNPNQTILDSSGNLAVFGSDTNSAVNLTHEIFEMALVNRVITQSEAASLWAYTNNRYAIS